MIQNNILMVVPQIINCDITIKNITDAKITKIGLYYYLDININQKDIDVFSLSQEDEFYKCVNNMYRFVIPTYKQVNVLNILKFGIDAMTPMELYKYFDFCGKFLINEKSLAARESSQALFFY